jgi:hypothetical protein
MSAERIWYKDLPGFMTRDNAARFVPMPGQSYVEQLNSVVRFALYFTIVMVLVFRRAAAVYFLAFALLLTWFLAQSDGRVERLNPGPGGGAGCVRPTSDNPFMNVLYSDDASRGPACDVLDGRVKRDIAAKFSRGLYRNANDVFDKSASDRQYYTTPITTIPNDQTSFAQWCYGTPPTCKEQSLSCWGGTATA